MNQPWQKYVTLFDSYDSAVDYELPTIADFQNISRELQPLYTVAERAKFEGTKKQTSAEPFVELNQAAIDSGVQLHFAAGSTALGSATGPMHLRTGAVQRLFQAARTLRQQTNDRYRLLLTDAYRPMALQRQHFNAVRTQLAAQGYHGDELYKRTTQILADPDLLPPHTTGGTVDITLYDVTTQQPAWFGTAVDTVDDILRHTWQLGVPPAERELRALLYNVMTTAGFVNYPLEWWHYSYGDNEWALHTRSPSTLYNSVESLPKE